MINLERPVILGTSESYRGEVVISGSRISAPYFNVCLLDYPRMGQISYITKCVFVSDSVLRFLNTEELPSSNFNSENIYVLGGISLGNLSSDACEDEIEFIAENARLLLPPGDQITDQPLSKESQEEAISFFRSNFVRQISYPNS